jgi:hypothetical protein
VSRGRKSADRAGLAKTTLGELVQPSTDEASFLNMCVSLVQSYVGFTVSENHFCFRLLSTTPESTVSPGRDMT